MDILVLVWLGGTDMHEEGKWVWSSGSSFNFSNFFSTKAINIAAEDCLYMYGDYGQWNDYYCNHRYDFVCERNLGWYFLNICTRYIHVRDWFIFKYDTNSNYYFVFSYAAFDVTNIHGFYIVCVHIWQRARFLTTLL